MQNLIKYFNACYQADNNSLTVSNFFGASVESRLIFDDEENLINGKLPYYPVEEDYAVKTDKIAKLYEKEKEFVYCSLFVIGKTVSFSNRITKICSPLIIHPAKIVKPEDEYFIQIDKSQRRINYPLLNRIREDESDNEIFLERITEIVTGFDIDDTTLFGLADIFKTFIPELDIEELNLFPKLLSEKQVKKHLQAKQLNELKGYKIIPASGAGIIKKSINTRGIINELNEISKSNVFSAPLKAIFNSGENIKKSHEKLGRVPGILSATQKKVLQNAPLFPASLIVGPPGTGKSYTVATLAIEQITKGKSILIASRTDQAVDVIADKIEKQLGIKGIIVRGGRSQYLRDLKKYLQNILNGIYKKDDSISSKELESDLKRLDKKIAKIENEFLKRIDDEMNWGKFIAEKQYEKGFFTNLKKKYINWRNEKLKTHPELISELDKALHKLNADTVKYIEEKHSENIEIAIIKHRKSLMNLLKALRARQGTKQEEYFKTADFKHILKVFPIWLVKMSDINKVLPLNTELFDIAIIDEATQCDIASSIPIIQRAKHAVFTGDPSQLRHVSFLSKAMSNNLITKFNLENYNSETLDYRHNSILDIVSNNISNQEQIFFLNEHYRSFPSIIRFSNEKFYSGVLRIMNSRPDISKNAGSQVIFCKGVRTKQGYNIEEADCIIKKLTEIIETEKELNEQTCNSIGILSPFRNQAEYISDLIEKKFTLNEIKKHNIRVSTAYGFQGDERDIMFLTFVLDNNSHPTAFRHINKPNVFNVSITRAKSMQYIYHSLNIKSVTTNSLLREYLESFSDLNKEEKTNKIQDKFIEEVTEELHKQGLKTWKAFPVAGLKIDIIVKIKDTTYGIDLIGYPGEFEGAFTIERYKMLQRAGLKTIPLSYTRWVSDKQNCFFELMKDLK
ncbi:MAG: AAA domain-containing protein [Bacteroidales bacterium]|nr:AAA domain-containing protein [Bacteroidales bacterium]